MDVPGLFHQRIVHVLGAAGSVATFARRRCAVPTRRTLPQTLWPLLLEVISNPAPVSSGGGGKQD